jgi:HD-GYP domain-containing protein (c-di-GMP phosphodiesterase class II)
MAVADVFDALVAERVYKKPFTYEKAMAIITEGAGKHFDTDIVEAFTHISERLYGARTKLPPQPEGVIVNADAGAGAAPEQSKS